MVAVPRSDLDEGKGIPEASSGDAVSPGCLFLETRPQSFFSSLAPPPPLPRFLLISIGNIYLLGPLLGTL